MNADFIKGAIVSVLTPVNEEENIDEKKLREQVGYVIGGDMLSILAFGSNGEFYVIGGGEMGHGLTIMVDQAAGRVPVYFGIRAISTKGCCHLAKMVVANDAADISVLQPMPLKPAENELYLHFKTTVKSVPETPTLLYNNPGWADYTLSASLVDHLAHEAKDIVGMKNVNDDITQASESIHRIKDMNFKMFGGKDALLYTSLCHDTVGDVCATASSMPGLITDVCNKFVVGDLNDSLEAQFKLSPVHLSVGGASFPVAAKDMADLRGREVGLSYTPNLPAPEGPVLDGARKEMKLVGLI